MRITVPHLEQQGKSFFCLGNSDVSASFFFLAASGELKHRREKFKGSFKSLLLYQRVF